VAIVENGTLPGQRVVEGTLCTIVAGAAAADIRPPALIVVGDTVALRATLQPQHSGGEIADVA
jgi:siroheme synthase